MITKKPFESGVVSAVLLLAIIVWGAALKTQHLWAPFSSVPNKLISIEPSTVAPGGKITFTYEVFVDRRYPAQFLSSIHNRKIGRTHDARISPPRTGQVGKFTISKTRVIPIDAEPGEWCFFNTSRIRYNMINEQDEPHEPSCFQVE